MEQGGFCDDSRRPHFKLQELQDMMPSIGKKNIFILLFFFYFFSYSVSPLSYNCYQEDCTDNICSAEKVPPSVRNVHIFLWDLLCAKFSVRKDVPPSHSAVTILIKKARAILRNSFSVASTSLGEHAATLVISLSLFSLFVSVPKELFTSHTRKGFLHLHSGLSPPSR